MIKSNIHNITHINGILFTDLHTKKFCNRYDFVNHSVEVCFALLVNLFIRNEDLIRIFNCKRGRRERTKSSFYMHAWNRLQRIKSVKIVVETSDKNQFSYFHVVSLFL